MLLIVGAISTVLGFLLFAAVAALLVRLVVLIVQGLAIAAVAALVATALGFGIVQAGADTNAAVLVGILAFPLLLWAKIRWLLRRHDRRSRAQPSQIIPQEDVPVLAALTPTLQPASKRYDGPAEPRADKAVARAWEALSKMVPASDRADCHLARSRCSRLLAKANGAAPGFEALECVVHIRRTVPVLAKQMAEVWSDAEDAERAKLAEDIVTASNHLGDWAARELDQLGQAARNYLAAVRAHIAARAGASDTRRAAR